MQPTRMRCAMHLALWDKTAMQELMGNNTVSADFSEIAKYIDAAKIRAATGQK